MSIRKEDALRCIRHTDNPAEHYIVLGLVRGVIDSLVGPFTEPFAMAVFRSWLREEKYDVVQVRVLTDEIYEEATPDDYQRFAENPECGSEVRQGEAAV